MFKNILYLHGIGSTGNGNTVKMLREAFPEACVAAPELPTQPMEAFDFIKLCIREIDPDLIIGTSLGGFYAMMISGIPKILINPAMYAADDIVASIGYGEHPYLEERISGETSYVVNETYVNELKQLQGRYFNNWYDSEYAFETFGVFGINDEVVSHITDFEKLFSSSHTITDVFGHRMTEEVFTKTVVPLINRVYQETQLDNVVSNFFD